MFYATSIVVFYVCYIFAFRQTLVAFQLNRTLSGEDKVEKGIGYSYPYLQKKDFFYRDVVNLYRLRDGDIEQRLWQAVSGVAIASKVDITLDPQVAIADSMVVDHISEHAFSFNGSYFALVKLLDTLHKTPGIGRISKLKIEKRRNPADPSAQPAQLDMGITFSGLTR